ncbi:DNA cytosine methyltransferase [Aliarcobacter cryaerophilus]|nr:DNA cytosine methyltransferase [Aliarcobacter cryaerophilus]MCT7481338.1 DNA cytosine methyltransferase [Aliarcobacter cryaerophilus]
MKFIDLFAGIGGFRTGFEREGFKCVFSCEIDKNCQQVYLENYGEKVESDITKIDEKKYLILMFY